MKILLVHPGAEFSVADVFQGWKEGLEQVDCTVGVLNLDERLAFYSTAGRVTTDGQFIRMVDDAGAVRLASKGIEAVCFEWWPDVVVFVSCFYVPLDTLQVIRARGIKVVLLCTEEPYERDRELFRAQFADLTLLNDPTHLEAFEKVGPAMWAPHAYRPGLHCPGPVDRAHASDFAFVGTAYPSRVEFLEAVDWYGIDVALGGNWKDSLSPDSRLRKFMAHDIEECCDNTETVLLYRSTKMSANLYRREADRAELATGWACGPREIELAATGTFFLRDPRGEGDTLFSMVPTFDSPEEFGDKLRWYLTRPDARQTIADAARAAVAERTFVNNARHLLRVLENQKG